MRMKNITDFVKIKIIDKLNNKTNKYYSCDTLVLRLHYKYGSSFSFVIYSCIVYNTFMETDIYCTNGFGNEDGKVRPAYVNYCLSYPKAIQTNEYILFYKWVPWIILTLCILLYVPKLWINYFLQFPFCRLYVRHH